MTNIYRIIFEVLPVTNILFHDSETNMDLKIKIKSLLQEAEIYRTQGLLSEAKDKFKAALALIQENDRIKNKQNLLTAIAEKIRLLETDSDVLEKELQSHELSTKAQDLIKKLFSFSDKRDKDEAALEGAIALAKFGQFESALAEFEELIKIDTIKVVAAKNMIRCHMANGSLDRAISKYQEWMAGGVFPDDQLEVLRLYLDDVLKKSGKEANLPLPSTSGEMPPMPSDEQPAQFDKEESVEFLDITSIGINFDSGPAQGKMVEFDVNFQSGNMLSLIISNKDKDLIENLKAGVKLNNIQYYSPIAIFKGAGIVSSRTPITNGPKKGDFCLDIKIVNQ
jgi:tetratricopeptide (TPR) repeat protein